jgi:hypothetical protein
MLEIINYYINNQSNIYAVMLDESKAFDRVHYIKLFYMLLEKGLCPLVAKLLLFMYINQSVNVRWDQVESSYFKVTNGVKQGGVLSPILFGIYMDGLLKRLKNTKVGCYIGDVFAGAIAYADDLILLAPTRAAMGILLDTCSSYAKEFYVKFNPDKSLQVVFGNNSSVPDFKMDGIKIPAASSGCHLGHAISKNASETQLNNAIYELHWRTNALHGSFKHTNINTKYSLFNSYCMSIYGSPLFDLYKSSIDYQVKLIHYSYHLLFKTQVLRLSSIGDL